MAILIAAIGVPAMAEPAKLVYENDFEKGIEKFTLTDPKAWQHLVSGGKGVMALTGESAYEPKVRSPKNIAWIDGLSVGNFVIEADIRQTGREYGHRDFCLFFGKEDAEHFYYVHLATKADDHANSIFLVNGAPRVSIAKERTDGTVWDDKFHKVRIVRNAESGEIAVYFDDMKKPAMTAVDKTFTDGAVGFGSFDDTGEVDSIKVWAGKAAEGSESK